MADIELFNACKFCDAKCCKGLAVVLTLPEAKRLIKEIGGNPKDYIEISCEIDSKKTPHYPFLAREKGIVKEYFLTLKRTSRLGDCMFLGAGGKCRIYDKRPHICRLYPFMLDGKEMKKNVLCPVKFKPEEYIEKVAVAVQKDLHEHGKLVRIWMHENPDKMPTVELLFEIE